MKSISEDSNSLKEIHRVRKELWIRWKNMSYEEIKKEISDAEKRLFENDHSSLVDIPNIG
jgi:hypothetical protein